MKSLYLVETLKKIFLTIWKNNKKKQRDVNKRWKIGNALFYVQKEASKTNSLVRNDSQFWVFNPKLVTGSKNTSPANQETWFLCLTRCPSHILQGYRFDSCNILTYLMAILNIVIMKIFQKYCNKMLLNVGHLK